MISTCKPLLLAAAVFAIALPVTGQAKQKNSQLPEIFLNATYVYVEAYDGNEYDPRLLPEDRKAIADVENAVRKWGRYRLAIRRLDAEIVIQVRKGRLASVQGRVGGSVESIPDSVQFPPSNRAETRTQVGAGAELGPPLDLFWVSTVDAKGNLSGPYWRKMEKDGLTTPSLELFKKFKDEVEAAAAAQAKKKAAATPATAPAHP